MSYKVSYITGPVLFKKSYNNAKNVGYLKGGGEVYMKMMEKGKPTFIQGKRIDP